MEITLDKASKLNNILLRMRKEFSIPEGFYITIRLYLTNNIYFYALCIILRFIPIIIISGDYITKSLIIENPYSLQESLKILTLHNLLKQIDFSFKTYIIICLVLFLIFIIRLIIYFLITSRIKNKKIIKKWSLLVKYQIIIDHISFLFFPYILEFLSFYY